MEAEFKKKIIYDNKGVIPRLMLFVSVDVITPARGLGLFCFGSKIQPKKLFLWNK